MGCWAWIQRLFSAHSWTGVAAANEVSRLPPRDAGEELGGEQANTNAQGMCTWTCYEEPYQI